MKVVTTMRNITASATLALMVSAGVVEAAAWPRGEGNGFVSLKFETRFDRERLLVRDFARDDRFSAFAEFGVTPVLTFGGEIARSGSGDMRIIETRGFARYAFLQSGRHVASVEAGVGRRGNDEGYEVNYLRLGAVWGMGYMSRFGDGWLEVEGASQVYSEGSDPAWKLDATVGLNAIDRVAVILQARAGDYPGAEPYLRLAPSVALRLTQRLRLQVEAQAGVLNDTGVGAALALWVDF
ncbi:hypothetical protein [Roseitranquillus sediminis]|uniref:hypothetical protein n=1 Tax=Roseitranquillus sediminis TaxID=2809051 RepID=UPI001D0BF965|nr:hypothetical protein [Roseitranquillus sediminis]MBM9595285.1 hypothetical protein [Roseitranquillus sediminis]